MEKRRDGELPAGDHRSDGRRARCAPVPACALLLLLWLTGGAGAEEPAPPPLPGTETIGPGEVPPVDVEASVRRLLEEAREGQAPAAAPVPPPAQKPAPVHREHAVPAGALSRGRPTPAEVEPEDFVPLPEGTITIRTLGDVETVAKELDEARRKIGVQRGAAAK